MGINTVRLDDVIEAFELCSEERKYYFNTITNEVISIGEEEMGIAEDYDDDGLENYPEWQQDEIEAAIGIIENWDNYLELPTRFEINEYDIMVEFCDSIDNNKIGSLLYEALEGKGAFRRFKDSVIRYNVEKKWYDFRDAVFKKIALEWCEKNNINVIDSKHI
jgi:hypothetical protein